MNCQEGLGLGQEGCVLGYQWALATPCKLAYSPVTLFNSELKSVILNFFLAKGPNALPTFIAT